MHKIYVDGSYNPKTKEYGFAFIVLEGNKVIYREYGKGSDKDLVSMRNVAGEILAAKKALRYCQKEGIKNVTIFYDYTGIENWALGYWKANKKGTIQYKNFYSKIQEDIKVNFVKVKSHSNDIYNDEVDRLAKISINC